jgi:alpha-L-rhamnosidase
MPVDTSRRLIAGSLMTMPIWPARAAPPRRAMASIVDFGAKSDGQTINSPAIQSAIDAVAARGGGTVLVPPGLFISGALFLKPGVHLHLAGGAVLKCTLDMTHFPPRRTRIEGHFEPSYTPALLNAEGCHGLRITGEGTLDGDGRPLWDRFWSAHAAAPDPANFPNLSFPRARLALIDGCRDVTIEGVTFKDSQFWNLHLYKCEGVTVRNARFLVPDDYRQAPSTDGIDVDSCRRVLIEGCYFSVTDDCVAAKGSKGPRAMEDRDSPPVEDVHVRDCHFRRGHHAIACGSEATIVRNMLVERCRVTGDMVLARLKLRPDTPQRYENIHFDDIELDSSDGTILGVEPWSQYKNLGDAAPPQSVVRNLTFSRLRGRFGGFGLIRPNPGQTRISDVRLRDIDLRLARPDLVAEGVERLQFDRVRVNGRTLGGR